MSKPAHAPRFYWLFSVLAGLVFCIIAVLNTSQVSALFSLVLCILVTGGLAHSYVLPENTRPVEKAGYTVLAIGLCIGFPMGLYLSELLKPLFMVGVLVLCQFCLVLPGLGLQKTYCTPTNIFFLTSVCLIMLSQFSHMEFATIVMLLCFVALCVALLDLSFHPNERKQTTNLPVLWMSFPRSVDVWAAAILLPTEQAIAYHAVRLFTLILPAALHTFETWVAPAMTQTRQNGSNLEFVSAMARINLGLFLVAGAVGLMIMIGQNLIFDHIFELEMAPTKITICLILSSFIPAALGQSVIAETLLVSAQTYIVSTVFSLSVGFCVFLLWNDISALGIVHAYLVYRVCHAAVHSVYMIKNFGIWPGPTALFVKQIRLLG